MYWSWLYFGFGIVLGLPTGALLMGILLPRSIRFEQKKAREEGLQDHISFLQADIAAVGDLLSRTPKSRYLERIPLERRLEDQREKLRGLLEEKGG